MDFQVKEELLVHQSVNLVCESLDTISDIFLNGDLIKTTKNSHVCHIVDVKDKLKAGENKLEVLFHSPVNYVNEHQAVERCPRNNNGLTGIPHIRKPQSHFGWDWGPVLTPSGISGNIYLQAENIARVKDLLVVQNHECGKVNLTISGQLDNYAHKAVDLMVDVICPNGKKLHCEVSATDKFETTVTVENPELWWTKELSDKEKQPLYTVSVSVKDDNGNAINAVTKKIGLRTIKLNQSVDQFGKNFQFVLNGVPIFAKGANWIPADSFINRVDRAKLEFYIKSAVDSNFNMLRVWGGGYYESDQFYDLCDEYGVLVWQDFCFACQPYPFFDKEFLENVFEEIACNVQRLRNHACLCLWCGNNEIEAMSVAWKNKIKYIKWTEEFFYNLLPEFLKKYDSITDFISGTPCGIDHLKGVNNDNVGDTHLWAVWHGLQPMTYYRRRMTRFCSEFGFESLPDIKTIKTFAKPEDYSLTSEVFSSHQKCNSGNMKMAYYIACRFRLPSNFTDYIYLSGVCQQECIKDATEHWRRNKGQCNGSLFWQYNDCWPVCSWASVDYYGNYKALQYTSKHFFAPLMVSLENTKNQLNVYVVNDKLESKQAKVILKLITFDGKTAFKKEVEVKAEINSSIMVCSVTLSELAKHADLKQAVLVADLEVNGAIINRKTLLFASEKNLILPKTEVKVDITIKDGIAKYTLSSDKYIRLLQLCSSENSHPFSDNYFDLLPAEKVVVYQKLKGTEDIEELRKQLSLFSAGDVKPGGSKLSDFIIRAKVFLTPVNFFSWIFYKSIPKKIKVK